MTEGKTDKVTLESNSQGKILNFDLFIERYKSIIKVTGILIAFITCLIAAFGLIINAITKIHEIAYRPAREIMSLKYDFEKMKDAQDSTNSRIDSILAIINKYHSTTDGLSSSNIIVKPSYFSVGSVINPTKTSSMKLKIAEIIPSINYVKLFIYSTDSVITSGIIRGKNNFFIFTYNNQKYKIKLFGSIQDEQGGRLAELSLEEINDK